jgi:hypothetical protein
MLYISSSTRLESSQLNEGNQNEYEMIQRSFYRKIQLLFGLYRILLWGMIEMVNKLGTRNKL